MDFNNLDNRHKRVLLYYTLLPNFIIPLVNFQNNGDNNTDDEIKIDKTMSVAYIEPLVVPSSSILNL